jgi:predicted metal-dependent phosphoesterase TrpH
VNVEESAALRDGWLKAELHSHCNLDPSDHGLCPYSAEELIRESARLGYQVLAITCHDLDVWSPRLSSYAADLGIILIPGMEVSTEGRHHTLVYNFGTGAEDLDTLLKIRRHSRPDTLVVAPHPYFPSTKCLGRLLDRNLDIFDAIEVSGFYATGLDFNRRARATAAAHGKPLVGNNDVHQLWQLERTCSWVQAAPNVGAILAAIKLGRVRIETRALSYGRVTQWWATALARRVASLASSGDRRRPLFLPGHPVKRRGA